MDEVPKDGEASKFCGSVMLALANSREEIITALKEDIYSTSDVWDWDRVQIYPVCTSKNFFEVKLMSGSSNVRLGRSDDALLLSVERVMISLAITSQ